MKSNLHHHRVLKISALVISLGLFGCGSAPMKTALTELGTSSKSEYGAFDSRFMRSINATGLNAEEVVGSLTVDPDGFSGIEHLKRLFPFKTDIPDSMSPRISTGATFVSKRKIGSATNGNTIETLTKIRDNLLGAQYSLSRWVSLTAKKEVLEICLTQIGKLELEKSTLSESQKNSIFNSLASLYPETFKDEKKKNIDEIKSALKIVTDEARLLESKLEEFKVDIQKSGIVITNWDRELSVSANANADGASISGNGKRKVSGFLILGDPEIFTLFFGNDLAKKLNQTDFKDQLKYFGVDFLTNRTYITHYQLRAKYLVFSESKKSTLQLNLDADLQKITEVLDKVATLDVSVLLKKINAKINIFYGAVTGVAESSVIDASAGEFSTTDLKMGAEQMKDFGNKTIPVMSFRINIGKHLLTSAN